jgi:hypothetical protein
MPLSDVQLRTATIILALPEAAGFALAGGAALVIHEIVDRGTKDLDCYLLVTSAADFARNATRPGTTEYEPAQHGVAVYERVAA